MGQMDGKVVVVTGAGGGIGRAEALLFAREGAKVLVNDLGGQRDGSGSGSAAGAVAAEIREAGGVAEANHDSVATAAGAQAIIDAAVKAFGHIDVLVNNAGILRDRTLLKLEEADWDAVIEVHLKGTFLCTQAAARQMIKQGNGGRIVNTTSVSGMMGNFGQTNYAAAKAGIYGLTRTAGIELQKHRITVNALAPIAKTRMTEDLPMFQSTTSLTPEHVAPAALFLGSDLCGARTGYVLAVAGARMYAYKVSESEGKFKDDNQAWTAREIADNWDAITRYKGLFEKPVAAPGEGCKALRAMAQRPAPYRGNAPQKEREGRHTFQATEQRSDPSIPALLWLCAAAVFHYTTYQGAEQVAEVGHGKLELRQFVTAIRGAVRPPQDVLEVSFVESSADPLPPEPEDEKKPEAKKPEAKKPEAKKPETKKPEEKKDEPKKEEPKKPELKKLEPKPEALKPPPPPPDFERKVAVRQHVDKKDQPDNPKAQHLANDANHVKEETQAKLTARGQEVSAAKPSMASNAAGPDNEVGNADKTRVAEAEDKPGNDKMPPGEKSHDRNDPLPKPVAPPPPAPAAPTQGDNRPRAPRAPVPAPAPTAAPPPEPKQQATPATQSDPSKGSYVVDPFRHGEDAKPTASTSATAPVPSAPPPRPYTLPGLGGTPGPKGVNFNLSPSMAQAAIGHDHDKIRHERELDGARRKSAHRGSYKTKSFDRWRPAIENYIASVKVGNTTALNTARAPFAAYLQLMHERLHPLFAEAFLEALSDLPEANPLNDMKMRTFVEIVLDGERGSIVKMGVTRTSGVTAFDVVALDSVERASGGSERGFGKPPSEIVSPDGNVYLHWEFHRDPRDACSNRNARPFLLKAAPKDPARPQKKAPPPTPERGKAG